MAREKTGHGGAVSTQWALNNVHLHAAAPCSFRQGCHWLGVVGTAGIKAGGRDGTTRHLCAGCRVHDGARKGSMCPCACEFFPASSRAPEPGKAMFELFQLQGCLWTLSVSGVNPSSGHASQGCESSPGSLCFVINTGWKNKVEEGSLLCGEGIRDKGRAWGGAQLRLGLAASSTP